MPTPRESPALAAHSSTEDRMSAPSSSLPATAGWVPLKPTFHGDPACVAIIAIKGTMLSHAPRACKGRSYRWPIEVEAGRAAAW